MTLGRPSRRWGCYGTARSLWPGVRDLRRQLDAAEAERREQSQRLTAPLADQGRRRTRSRGTGVCGGHGEVTARSLRRMAQRQGLTLVKHRVRDTRALNYRCYIWPDAPR
jgi:hypothetical protein